MIIPKCNGCGRTPDEIPEYTLECDDVGLSATDYVRRYEGTYNEKNGHFLCTECYIGAGCPSSPNGWVAP